MENQLIEIEEINFEPKKISRIEKQRKILAHYAKPDQQRQRKPKAETFTKQNIQGLFSVLQINQEKLQFIPTQLLCTETTIFMQNAKRIFLQTGNLVEIIQNTFIILIEGCLVKKQSSYSSMSHGIFYSSKNKRSSNNDPALYKKRSAINVVSQLKKMIGKKIFSNQNLSPKMIYYDSSDLKPFECKSDVTYLQFDQSCLQKLQAWVDIKEKDGLVDFVSICFGVQDRKGVTKIIPKLSKLRRHEKSNIEVAPNTVFMVYEGEVFLKTKTYQTILNKNSLIYFESSQKNFQVRSTNQSLLLFSVQMYMIVQCLEQSFSETLNQIKEKMTSLHDYRQKMWKKIEQPEEEEKRVEPIFNTEILNMKSFQRNVCEKNGDNDYFKYIMPASSVNSTRFRIQKGASTDQNIMEPQSSAFLSGYPYMKLVEGEIKIHKILTQIEPTRIFNKRTPMRDMSQEQIRKAQKNHKKMYYMDKVRRLKIRNIAEREIPNGHRKKFKVEEAEKQIEDFSLFSNIIYPLNGTKKTSKISSKVSTPPLAKSKIDIRTDFTPKQVLNWQKQIDNNIYLTSLTKESQQEKLEILTEQQKQKCSIEPVQLLKPRMQKQMRYKLIKTSYNNRRNKENCIQQIEHSPQSLDLKPRLALKMNNVSIQISTRPNTHRAKTRI